MARARDSFGWQDEVFGSLRRQRNIAGWIAALSLMLALAAVATLALILPLKEVRPYVVMVDRTTGESELVVNTRPANLAEREAVRQAELVRYVTARETYDPADNPQRIPSVLRRSSDQAAASLRTLWTSSNPEYPPNRYGARTLITVKIRSVTLLDADTAQVRFVRRLERDNDRAITRDFVATVGFRFEPRTERNLEAVWRNPLGFTVTAYRIDAETLDPRADAGDVR